MSSQKTSVYQAKANKNYRDANRSALNKKAKIKYNKNKKAISERRKLLYKANKNKADKYRKHQYYVGDTQKTIREVVRIKTLEVKLAALGCDGEFSFGRFKGFRMIDIYRNQSGKWWLRYFINDDFHNIEANWHMLRAANIASKWKI